MFQELSDMSASGRPMDAITIGNWLKSTNALGKCGGYDYLVHLQSETIVAAHVNHYCDIVKEKRRYRLIIEKSSEAIDQAYKQELDADEILNSERTALYEVDSQSNNERTNAEEADIAVEHWRQVVDGVEFGLPWHVSCIGNVFGRLQGFGNPFFIAAEPGGGKSVCLQKLLETWAIDENRPVCCASIEMTRQKFIRRVLASRAEVNMWSLENGHYGMGSEEERFERAHQWIRECDAERQQIINAPFHIEDRTLNTDQIISYFLRQYEYNGVQAAIVDYFQLMNPPEHKKLEGLDVVKYNCDKLREFSKPTGVVVVAASQITKIARNHQGETRIPEQDDLFGGRIIDANSEGTIIFYRRDGQDFCNIAKNRNGNTGIIEVVFNRPMLRFENPSLLPQTDNAPDVYDDDDDPF